MAERAGLSVPHLSAIERGARNPPYLRVVGIASALRVKVAELTG
jgi:transcriptional regulator with XRE-family HTH domain